MEFREEIPLEFLVFLGELEKLLLEALLDKLLQVLIEKFLVKILEEFQVESQMEILK